MISTGVSELGLIRKNNEDSFYIDDQRGLYIVCDGMGGHNGGEVASGMAVEIVSRDAQYTNAEEAVKSLRSAIEKANHAIWSKGRTDPELYNMGTTITAAAVIENTLVVAHVGDSSLFLIRSDKIQKITRDHTLAESMVDDGILKPGEIRNNSYNHILTRAVGVEEKVEIDFFTCNLNEGDHILLCSDGLTDLLDSSDILEVVTSDNINVVAQNLIQFALNRGGHDNITIILVVI
jgi:serine/threonine protein phosphatase PrpC